MTLFMKLVLPTTRHWPCKLKHSLLIFHTPNPRPLLTSKPHPSAPTCVFQTQIGNEGLIAWDFGKKILELVIEAVIVSFGTPNCGAYTERKVKTTLSNENDPADTPNIKNLSIHFSASSIPAPPCPLLLPLKKNL